jgi:hypothetical protein
VNADEWEIGCPFLAMSQRVRSEQGSPLSPCRLTEPGGDPIRLGDQVIDAEPQEQGLLQLVPHQTTFASFELVHHSPTSPTMRARNRCPLGARWLRTGTSRPGPDPVASPL